MPDHTLAGWNSSTERTVRSQSAGDLGGANTNSVLPPAPTLKNPGHAPRTNRSAWHGSETCQGTHDQRQPHAPNKVRRRPRQLLPPRHVPVKFGAMHFARITSTCLSCPCPQNSSSCPILKQQVSAYRALQQSVGILNKEA